MRLIGSVANILLLSSLIYQSVSSYNHLKALNVVSNFKKTSIVLAASISSADAQSNKPIVINISGMKCMGCLSRVKTALLAIDPLVDINFELKHATLPKFGKDKALDFTTLAEINTALRIEGDYVASIPKTKYVPKVLQQWIRSLTTFTPLLLVMTGITCVTVLLQKSALPHLNWSMAMRHFMGLFFVTFSVFKLVNLRNFVNAFSQYDVLTRRYQVYGYLYPFIELLLGASYLSKYRVLSAAITNAATIALMSATTVGVVGVLRSPSTTASLQCACLGSLIKLPMTQVTLIENMAMIGMSLILLACQIH